MARLEAVQDRTRLVERTLGLSLWRYLDPAPLLTTELDPTSDETASLHLNLGLWPPLDWHTVHVFIEHLRLGLRSKEFRFSTLDALWFRLRASYAVRDLAEYVLCYLLWQEAAHVIKRDPVLGCIASSLYAHTAYYFGRLRIDPPLPDTFDRAIQSLRNGHVQPTLRTDPPHALVDLQQLADIDSG